MYQLTILLPIADSRLSHHFWQMKAAINLIGFLSKFLLAGLGPALSLTSLKNLVIVAPFKFVFGNDQQEERLFPSLFFFILFVIRQNPLNF